MALDRELDKTKVMFIDTCRRLLELGELSEEEYLGICDLLDRLDELDKESFEQELRRISRGLSDLIS
ncbi:MAG: hypothetical protein WBI99_01725 [Limnochordia bacterium]|jgi:hypothetical protein|nr:hypothetical protein [Limnochordia bacterium]MDI9466107.1 hypothetical protein [Bacillota bacterium]NLO95910.1 hypothetical protein [Bacillota bacterium]HAI52755.1 hypothetical protein [Bacillota bacterium]HAN95310.1 hypothetical protein [Bacillota bacterium]